MRSARTAIQLVKDALSPGLKRPGNETGHNSPSSAEFRIRGAIFVILHLSVSSCRSH